MIDTNLRARTGFDFQSKLRLASRGGYVRPQTAWQKQTITTTLFRLISLRRNWLSLLKVATFIGSILARPMGDDSEETQLYSGECRMVEDAGSRVPKACKTSRSGNWEDRGSTPLAST